jgi:hypothetical protein
LVLPKKLVAPSEIIEYLKQEQTVQTILAHPHSENSDETVHEEQNHSESEYLDTHTEVSNHTHQFPPSVTSQHSLARYVIDNNLITHVPSQRAFIVQGRGGKYCVTLFPKEKCQCPSTTTCFHLLAAKMSIEKRTVVNLRLLTKNSKKTIDKKSGRKQLRANDNEATFVEPAPDSDFVLNTPITPHSTMTKLPTHSALKRQTKTPVSKKKLQLI